MGLIVVDASIVIALRDARDAHHEAARSTLDEVRESNRLVLPSSALAESIVRPLSAGFDVGPVVEPILRLFTIEPSTAEIAVRAAQLRATGTLRLADALVVATGIHLDAGQILTCDERWKKADQRVKVLSGR